ncbi:hypothetical protein [Streptomyces sp. NBC_00005]|uniref:hypothetical protein n=1 Tax=Streptomyces sp. NBC_00005 TaxID=2903609 RepID=UPI002F90BE36
MTRDALISHRYFGWTPDTSYVTAGLSLEEAQRLIGANTLAGFEPVVYTRTPVGDVVALHGSSLRGVIEIAQV